MSGIMYGEVSGITPYIVTIQHTVKYSNITHSKSLNLAPQNLLYHRCTWFITWDILMNSHIVYTRVTFLCVAGYSSKVVIFLFSIGKSARLLLESLFVDILHTINKIPFAGFRVLRIRDSNLLIYWINITFVEILDTHKSHGHFYSSHYFYEKHSWVHHIIYSNLSDTILMYV